MGQAAATARYATVDADILVAFIKANRLDVLEQLPGTQFVVSDTVLREVAVADQQNPLLRSIDRGFLERASVKRMELLEIYRRLRARLDPGESACIALAAGNDWFVATDERGATRSLIQEHVGLHRHLTSADILLDAVRTELLSVPEADKLAHTFDQRYSFDSIGDFLP